jgi:V/A-type H+-transporting ATPase subunit I
MQNVTVVCLGTDREATVRQLQELGTLHVTGVTANVGEPTLETQRLVERYAAAIMRLQARDAEPDAPLDGDSSELLAETEASIDRIAEAQERILANHRALSRLAPWGSFSFEDIKKLDDAGYQVVLSSATEEHIPPALPEGAIYHEISRNGKTVYFAVVAPAKQELELHAIPFPERTDARAIEADTLQAEKEIADSEKLLDRLVNALPTLELARAKAVAELDFLRAKDGMGEEEQLCWLQGYIPERAVETLVSTAGEKGWAVRHEPADRDDPKVPTFIDYDRFGIFRIAKPLFDFIGISPAYNENDVSICVLLFLTLFFGIIIGDAAYGAIFLAAGFYARTRVKDPKKRVAVGLFILLSAAAFIWGALNGTWFAIPQDRLPAPMRGLTWFQGEAGQTHTQWLCFLIAGIQLSLGRFWKAWSERDLAALGHIGWALFIWGNFFTAVELVVSKGSFPPAIGGSLYGAGLVLILAFGVKWKDVGDVLNLPFSFVNSFVDVLSYIRLFAVGLSSYYIAKSFNDLGTMVLAGSPWLFPAAALIIIFGHVLNVALGFMGVLVHGIRLNTLEFSNHMELTWSGKAYKPLRKAESN